MIEAMFTGLVEGCADVVGLEPLGAQGLRLWIEPRLADFSARLGQSIAVSGACLSVSRIEGRKLGFDLSAETLARTWFGGLQRGDLLNLERAMTLGERLDGHLVSGHIDGVGQICAWEDPGDGGQTMEVEVPPQLARYLVDKGSIAVDGISLTVVSPRERRFRVALIPLTLEHTSLGRARVGQRVNLEADCIGKWVERLLRAPTGDTAP